MQLWHYEKASYTCTFYKNNDKLFFRLKITKKYFLTQKTRMAKTCFKNALTHFYNNVKIKKLMLCCSLKKNLFSTINLLPVRARGQLSNVLILFCALS